MIDRAELTAGEILGISGGYWPSFVLHTGTKLEVFSLMGDESLSAGDIADQFLCRPGLLWRDI